jgi:Metallo-peptidase family M12
MLLALFGLLCLAPAAIAQDSPEIFREIAAPSLSAGADAARLQGPNVVRSRYVEVDLERVLAPAAAENPRPARARGAAGKRLTFNLFADAVQEFEEDHAEYSDDGQSYSWYGRPTTPGGGQALLVVHDGAVAGSVRTASGEFYRIRSVSSNVQVIRQVAYQGSPPMPDAVPVPESEVPQAAKAQQATAEQSGTTTLDVLVVYTAGARQAAGGTSAIQSEIQLAIAELNQSFNSSGVQMQARLAHSAEVSYSNEQADLGTSLSRLRTPGDGYLDEVHALRDQYGADVVALLVNGPGSGGGTVGTGYIMQTVGSYFADYAFSVTEVNFATGPAYALLHEIGHNLGCAHDRANASSAGAYAYSYGYQRAASPRFRTIMAYNCSGVNCPTIDNWSNPNVNYSGYPTGVSSSVSNSADNRQTLNNTKATAAAWRDSTSSGGGGGGGGGTVNSAPAVVSVSPSSGSGSSQTFRLTVSDANGFGDLSSVQFTIGQSGASANSCNLAYGPPTNGLYLLNDARTAWMGPVKLGSSGSLSNSQCSVNMPASSASGSGTTLTVDLALSFTPSFAGTKNIYLYALDKANADSGWQTKGTWTIPGGAANQAPAVGTVTPSSGSGSSQTFQLKVSDGSGFGDLTSVQMVVDQGLGRASSCYLAYGPPANGLYLLNDNQTQWMGPKALGSSGTLANSQCSVNLGASSASGSGSTLTMNVNLSFSNGFSGAKNVYAYALDSQNQNSGWQTRGTWTVPGAAANAAPAIGTLTPSSGSGSSKTFQLTVSDGNGYGDLISVQMVVDQSLGRTNTCYLAYGPPANGLYLLNDARTQWMGPMAVGSSGTLGNSQCSVNLGASSASKSGNNLTLNLNMSFSSGFAGTKNIYAYALDSKYQDSGWQTKGTWIVPGTASNQPPAIGSVSPSSGSGSTQTFRMTVSDPNGYGDLISVQLVADQTVGSYNTCYLAYGPQANGLFLLNDSATQWMGPVALGSSGTIANSQCSVNLGASSSSGSGNNLTVDLNLTFSNSYKGTKNLYMYTLDKQYLNSGWQTKGAWTVN